jgi:hypothetical protein
MTDTDEFNISFNENEMERMRNSVIVPVVPVIPRKEFIKMFARDYHAGQHVTFLGPSGRGKTKLMGQLLLAVLRYHKDITARVLHGKIKDRDETIIRLSKEGKLPITPDAAPSWWQKNVSHRDMRGFIVRPLTKPEGSPDSKEDLTERENQHLRRVFRRVIYKAYHAKKKKPVIVVVDEAHQAHTVLRLKSDCEGPLMRGRPVCGMWSLLQRGRFVSKMVYDQPEWVFIFHDPVIENQRMYAEIGGVNPRVLVALSARLQTHTAADGSTYSQCLAFRRSGDYLCIVDT